LEIRHLPPHSHNFMASDRDEGSTHIAGKF
jgi:hypothetical protein